MFRNSISRPLGIMAVLAFLGTISHPTPVTGTDVPSTNSSRLRAIAAQSAASLSVDEIRLERAEVEASQGLDAASKDRAIKMLDQAIGFAEARDELNRISQSLSEQIESAPQRIKTIQSELAKPIPPPQAVKAMAGQKNALELEQRLQKEQAQLSAAKDLQAGWNDQLKKQKDLIGHLPKDIADTKARLKTVNEELQNQPAAGDPALITESRRLMLLTEQSKLKAEIKLYEQQLNSHEVLVSLARAELDLATREVAKHEDLTKAWQTEVTAQVQQDAAKEIQEAEAAKDKAPELATALKDQYDINIALSEKVAKLAEKVTAVTNHLDQVSNQLKEIEEDFALATERVQSLVLTETIGLALRRQRQLLPSVDKYQRGSSERKMKMSEIREIQYGLERQRRELVDIESKADEIIDSLVYLKPEVADTLRPEVRNLLIDRRQLLEKLQTGYNQYFKGLQNLEFAEQQLVTKAEAYADFLDAHLVWIRSSSIINLTDLKNSLEVLHTLVNPANWRLFADDMTDSFRDSSARWVLGFLVIAVLLLGRRRARREISSAAEKVQKPREDHIILTVWVLVLTVYLAVGFPALMFFMGRQLLQIPGSYDFTRAVATGLVSAAPYLALLRFFYHLVRRNGLAHVHFRWHEAIRKALRRNLIWITPIEVLTAFLVYTMTAVREIAFGDSMAKLALIAQLIALTAFFGWILRFSGGIVTTLLKQSPTGWLARLRHIWWTVAVGFPLFLAALVASGYFLSALQLRIYMGLTIALVLGLTVLNSLALRWLTLARQRLARREALRKRKAQQAADRSAAETDEDRLQLPAEPEIGLVEIGEQTQTLLRTVMFVLVAIGLWAIWEPVFPAFGILDDIHLWSYSGVVDGVATPVPISLANLIMAVVVVVITVIASRNLPGLLEITILNRLPMDAGALYALTNVSRYAITTIGIILAFNTIGFRWSSVQWLIAALGVGLGFGLQEIVANFICGLIVLFERPFRVGDTVTIGETDGTVARIRIRATTIVDWDRKELIVPNKEFITGRLINWSLSDPVTRFKIYVGIAYGSDTELAEKLLLKVLHENPMVLNDPKPSAYFLGFGDNSLNFELRLFINNIDYRLPVQHELHKAIDREFRKAGIVIAFPQRDVHFDADQPLKVQMVPGNAGKTADDPEPEPEPSP